MLSYGGCYHDILSKEKKTTYDIGLAVRGRMLCSEETIIRGSRKQGDDSHYTLVKCSGSCTKYLEL